MKIVITQEHLYIKLQKAIDQAPTIPPCQVTDPDVWYAEKDQIGNQYRLAKQMCTQCPVIRECADYAIEAQEMEGCWGGLSPRERMAMWKAKRGIGRPKKQTT
jgi:WhiB family redox-sensing transcriptional regulator